MNTLSRRLTNAIVMTVSRLVNCHFTEETMKISYANDNVKRVFQNYDEMKKRISPDWVRSIKKHIDRLEASSTFKDFLSLSLGHPEPLKGNDKGLWSLRINANIRLIFALSDDGSAINITEVIMKGVADYHGNKQTWFIR